MLKKSRGFTIVEVLIVIVVIAILATLTVVVYDGASRDARNAQTAASVKIYVDALVLHKSLNGKYPTGNANKKTCLGTGYDEGKCWGGDVNENAAFTQALKTVYGDKLPSSGNKKLGLKGAWFSAADTGINVRLDNKPEDFVIYSVEGNATKCPVGPIASDAGDSNILTYSSTPPASGQTIAGNASGSQPAQCWIPLSLVR